MRRSLAWLCPLLALAACHRGGGSKWLAPGGGGNGGGGNVEPPTCTSPTMASLDAPNAVELTVDQGPAEAVAAGRPYVNGLFATVTLCVPGTNNCQTVDHLLVDTGSVGIRVLGSILTLPLQTAKADSSSVLGECLPFVDGDAWGLVKTADVRIGGEFAGNVPIQVIGDTSVTDNIPIPSSCNNNIITDLTGTRGMGTKGILGVGLQPEDCGANCPATSSFSVYFACGTTCKPTSLPVAKQVPHPAALFPTNNNGVMIQLPCVPELGSPAVSGVMVFGIGTQANNELGSANVLATDQYGFLTTTFPAAGEDYVGFLDTGSNGLFFLDAETSGLKACPGQARDFYCPSSTTHLAARIVDTVQNEAPVVFSVANPMDFPDENFAFSTLGGSFPGFPDPRMPSFDWGLPFHFGRTVFVAIEGRNTPAGPGPYQAF